MVTDRVETPDDAKHMIAAGPWYAVRSSRISKNFERTSTAILSAKGVETDLPVYGEMRKWSDRTKFTEIHCFRITFLP